MSFVTYVLLIAVSLGLSKSFRPEVLGLTSSRALLIVGVELALIRLCTYLFNVQGDHYGILDLLSYSGYKFVPACVTLSMGVLGWGKVLWWSTFFYTYASLAFFLVRIAAGDADECTFPPDINLDPLWASSYALYATSYFQTRRRRLTRPLLPVWSPSRRDSAPEGCNSCSSSPSYNSSWVPGCASALQAKSVCVKSRCNFKTNIVVVDLTQR